MKNRTLTVGLAWHSISSDNLGVGALTLSQMALISKAAEQLGRQVEFVIIGTRGDTPYPITDFKLKQTTEFAVRAFKTGDFSAIKAFWQCDIVFDIGEGDSYADIYGFSRITRQVLTKALSKLAGNTLILSPQTIGPFHTGKGRFMGKLGMRFADRIYARDHLSSTYVRELGFEHKLSEVIDVAFALPFQPQPKANNVTRVGINVSGLMMHDGPQFKLALDYPKLIKKAIAYFTSLPNVEVHLVSHVICDAHENEDDLRACARLAEKFPDVKLAPRFRTPSQAKSYISGLDFFTGARMHACIGAFSSGVTVVPMAYSRKFNGLFTSLGYDAVLDCLKLDTDQAYEFLIAKWQQRAELAPKVAEGNAIAQQKLNRYVADIVTMLPA